MTVSLSDFRPMRQLQEKQDAEHAIVVNCCERLQSFLATNAEVKVICSVLPAGHTFSLPLGAGTDGLFIDIRLAQLANEATR